MPKVCHIIHLPPGVFQGSRIFVFGGTSPYDGPPIKFTPRQLEFMPRELDPDAGDVDGRRLKLLDHSEMFVLDLSPRLGVSKK